jgi:hypothetical protein
MDNPRLLSHPELEWFASPDQISAALYQRYSDALATTLHKVDILIDASGGVTTGELIARLAQHPKVRSIVLTGVDWQDRAVLAAEAALSHVTVRFCDSDVEVQMLLNKRRAQVIRLETPQAPHLSGATVPPYLESAVFNH